MTCWCVRGPFEEHLEHLRQVFARLREANLKLKPKKCLFFGMKFCTLAMW